MAVLSFQLKTEKNKQTMLPNEISLVQALCGWVRIATSDQAAKCHRLLASIFCRAWSGHRHRHRHPPQPRPLPLLSQCCWPTAGTSAVGLPAYWGWDKCKCAYVTSTHIKVLQRQCKFSSVQRDTVIWIWLCFFSYRIQYSNIFHFKSQVLENIRAWYPVTKDEYKTIMDLQWIFLRYF